MESHSNLSGEIIIDGDGDCATEVVEEEDVLDVQLAEKPAVVLRPVFHVGMPGEESLPGHHSLLRVGINLHDGAGEDDMSAPSS